MFPSGKFRFDPSSLGGSIFNQPGQRGGGGNEVPPFLPMLKSRWIFPVKKTSKKCRFFGGPMVFCMYMYVCSLEVFELRNSAFFLFKKGSV